MLNEAKRKATIERHHRKIRKVRGEYGHMKGFIIQDQPKEEPLYELVVSVAPKYSAKVASCGD